LPFFLVFFVMIVVEESAASAKNGSDVSTILAVGEVVIGFLFFAVTFFLCFRLRAVGKAMHHDLEGLSQRFLSQYKIQVFHQPPQGSAAQPGSQKPEMLVFTSYGDVEPA
jgi:hypothetical protein